MPDGQFKRMRDIIAAPSPVNLESAMAEGTIIPMFKEFMPDDWKVHRYAGNAGIVIDTDPTDTTGKLKVMLCGHLDKIRMQVRHISDDGKVWVNSDSFLPATLIGNRVTCFATDLEGEDELRPKFRQIPGTIEALGAIHFAKPSYRTGDKGIEPKQLYLELGIYGKKGKKQVEDLGIRPGQSILLERKIERCVGPDTFSGAYLDNGLGCFVVEEVARALHRDILSDVRVMFAFASHEEIGRFGSRVLVESLRPDVLVAIDVDHDYQAAPIGKEEKQPQLEMGKGCTITHGSIASPFINAFLRRSAQTRSIPYQLDVRGRDTGTDAMAPVLAGIDCATTSVGFPIRNMHTISELAHTGDVLASIELMNAFLTDLAQEKITVDNLQTSHFRLDDSTKYTC